MPDFGDEFIIESFKVPWLIWIQLLVMILLIVLLFFGFSVFTSDPSSSSSSASTSVGDGAAPPTHLNKPSSSYRRTKVEVERTRTRRDEETNSEFIREEDQSGEESSSKDSMFLRIFRHPNHPCNYFGLAKQALLKCFGLDSSSELSSSHQHDKQE